MSEVLRQKLKQADILILKGATMAEKRQEALEEQSRLEPRIDLLAGRTRELQKLVLNYFFHRIGDYSAHWIKKPVQHFIYSISKRLVNFRKQLLKK